MACVPLVKMCPSFLNPGYVYSHGDNILDCYIMRLRRHRSGRYYFNNNFDARITRAELIEQYDFDVAAIDEAYDLDENVVYARPKSIDKRLSDCCITYIVQHELPQKSMDIVLDYDQFLQIKMKCYCQ